MKKKRKVEVKEFVQDGKYMRTVFREEWQEYSTDEEEHVRRPAPAVVLKNKNGGGGKKAEGSGAGKKPDDTTRGKKTKGKQGASKDIRSFFSK